MIDLLPNCPPIVKLLPHIAHNLNILSRDSFLPEGQTPAGHRRAVISRTVEAVLMMRKPGTRRAKRHASAASVSHPPRRLKTAGPWGHVVLLTAMAGPSRAAILGRAPEGRMSAAAVFLMCRSGFRVLVERRDPPLPAPPAAPYLNTVSTLALYRITILPGLMDRILVLPGSRSFSAKWVTIRAMKNSVWRAKAASRWRGVGGPLWTNQYGQWY
jgi:hypothetical protein